MSHGLIMWEPWNNLELVLLSYCIICTITYIILGFTQH